MIMSLLLVAALVAPSLSAFYLEPYQCPAGWTLLDKTCFLVSSNSGSWNEGMDFCNKQGATLATIISESQQTALSAMLTDSVWIGLSDLNDDHNYGWADDSKYEYSRLQNEEYDVCVEMKKNVGFLWHAEECIEARQFLCSTPAKLITTTTTTTTPALHSHGWIKYGSSYYQVSKRKGTWEDARARCKQKGGDLAIIYNEEVQKLVERLIKTDAWIGLHKVDDVFLWVDGSHLGYTNWNKGQPNDMNMDVCVELKQLYAYRWNDLSCSTKLKSYVCEKIVQH